MKERNRKIYRISELSSEVAKTLEHRFSSVWIQGEMSNFISHNSGHWYFSLKEKEAQIQALMFKGNNTSLAFKPQNGEEILVRGRISIYVPRGTYQIVCHAMKRVGEGDLQKQFEELKAKLKKEGLFDSKYKKPLPPFPKHVALITSPTGAAIRDILQILNRRFRDLRITLIPALVQGKEASPSLIKALKSAEKIKDLECLIITRGGGSKEDLSAFNSEDLARTIFTCPIPVISAVGHEIDFTICDFVSDLRAPTPSSAGELLVKNTKDLLERNLKIKKELFNHLKSHLRFWKERLRSLEKQLSHPKKRLEDYLQKVDELSYQLVQNTKLHVRQKSDQIKNLKKLLQSLSPERIMERGFSIVTSSQEKIITDSKQISLKDKIHLQFFKGRAEVIVSRKK